MFHVGYQFIGFYLSPIADRFRERLKLQKDDIFVRVIKVGITFLLVNFAWIFFRAESVREAVRIIVSILKYPSIWVFTNEGLYQFGLSAHMFHMLMIWILILFAVDFLHEKGVSIRESIASYHLLIRWGIFYAAIFSILLFGAYGIGYNASDFIYMQF